MQQPTTQEIQSENRTLLACLVLTLTAVALRVSELAGTWGAL